MARERPVGQRLFTAELWPVLPPLLGMLVGLSILAAGEWRAGLLIIGASVGLAGLLRLVLPPRVAGLLVVRSRTLDTVIMIGLGTVIITVALLR